MTSRQSSSMQRQCLSGVLCIFHLSLGKSFAVSAGFLKHCPAAHFKLHTFPPGSCPVQSHDFTEGFVIKGYKGVHSFFFDSQVISNKQSSNICGIAAVVLKLL